MNAHIVNTRISLPARLPARFGAFLFGSMLLHMAVSAVFWRDGDFAQGALAPVQQPSAQQISSAAAIAIRILTAADNTRSDQTTAAAPSQWTSSGAVTADSQPEKKTPADDVTVAQAVAGHSPFNGKAALGMAQASAVIQPVFLPAGQLTRLPAPLQEIDLNVPEITALAPGEPRQLSEPSAPSDHAGQIFQLDHADQARQIVLNILINADGSVADVRSESDAALAGLFAQRVANRFRQARFAPGEIDGQPVATRLPVVILSEALKDEHSATAALQP